MRPTTIVGLLAVWLTAAPALATDYASNPNPACRLMRNVTPDAPYPAEPNRADTQVAQTATALHNYRRHLGNLQWARGALGDLLRAGTVGQADKGAAVAVYRRAVDASFTDDRGCCMALPRPSTPACISRPCISTATARPRTAPRPAG